jgi:hypothetical protein
MCVFCVLVCSAFAEYTSFITAKQRELMVESVSVSKGDIIEILFPEGFGFFYVAKPSSYSVRIARSCQHPRSPDCLWYGTSTEGLFVVGNETSIAQIIATNSGTFVITVGYLFYEYCSTVWVTNQAKFESLESRYSTCVISSSTDSQLRLRSIKLNSSDLSVMALSPKTRRTWTLNGTPSGEFSALMCRHGGSHTFRSPNGENLIESVPSGALNLGYLSREGRVDLPAVQSEPSSLEQLERLAPGDVHGL